MGRSPIGDQEGHIISSLLTTRFGNLNFERIFEHKNYFSYLKIFTRKHGTFGEKTGFQKNVKVQKLPKDETLYFHTAF